MSYLTRTVAAPAGLPAAGFFATAVAFGPARMGFGLFLPQFREVFGFTSQTAGLIAAAAFTAFLLSLPAAAWLLNHQGPRAPVLTGGLAAALGFCLAAAADSGAMLAVGVVLAAASAGFAWTPYNNAAERIISRDRRAATLSVISTGTTMGVAAAGALSISAALSGLGWREVWTIFAVCALAMTVLNIPALRPVAGDPGRFTGTGAGWRSLKRAETVPLAVAALSFGISTAVYLSFAVDRATASGALAVGPLDSAAPLLFVSYGLVGIVGLLTGEFENRVGLVVLMWGIFAASAVSFALLALLPGTGWAVLLSAGLQGAVVMTASAAFSFWTARLFPQIPSISFTAVLIAVAAGSVVGPAAAGWAADRVGFQTVFLAGAALSLVTPILMPADAIESASSRSWRPGRRSRTIAPAPE